MAAGHDAVVARVNGELQDLAARSRSATSSSRSRSTAPTAVDPSPLDRARAGAGRAGPLPAGQARHRPADHQRLLLRLRRRPAVHARGPQGNIEKEMKAILQERQRFHRRVVTDDEARAELADEPLQARADRAQGRRPRMTADEAGRGRRRRAHDLRQRAPQGRARGRSGKTCAAARTCPTPADPRLQAHAYRRRLLARRARRTRSCSASTAPRGPPRTALDAHLTQLEEAEKRDHRRLGTELDLFCFPERDRLGSLGLAPERRRGTPGDGGVQPRRATRRPATPTCTTPHIAKEDLFQTSGHLALVREGMYPPHRRWTGATYYLKPMNCPMHILIYKARGAVLPRSAACARRVRHRLPLRDVRRAARPHPRPRLHPGRQPPLLHARAAERRARQRSSSSSCRCCATSA